MKDKAVKVLDAIMTEVYAKATPSDNWAEMKVKHKGVEDWYLNYTIKESVFNEILERHLKQSKLRLYYVAGVRFEAFNYGPKFI